MCHDRRPLHWGWKTEMSAEIGTGKKVVCITGTVWRGGGDAPRNKLVKAGFVRPTWFTTTRGISDGEFRHISMGSFHLASSRGEVMVHIEYGGGRVGIMNDDFNEALSQSGQGVLVVAPPDIAAQLAHKVPGVVLFALKCASMELSKHLAAVSSSQQFHRIDIDSEKAGAWDRAYDEMELILGL